MEGFNDGPDLVHAFDYREMDLDANPGGCFDSPISQQHLYGIHRRDGPDYDAIEFGRGSIDPREDNCMPQMLPSARSSASSNGLRLSNNSTFSHSHWRGSVASTNTTWSNASDHTRDHHVAQAQRILDSNSSGIFNPAVALALGETPVRIQKQQTQRRPSQTIHSKAQFSTCVSRTKRSRRSMKEPRYWCTSCKEGFGEKYDWKRHEETYQERSEDFRCELCKKTYFLDKDFVHHHRESHRCQTCSENGHVEIARRKRATRTGYGCGFCLRFDSDWTERCNHIAWHFENGQTISAWSQTQVIHSLLHRPDLLKEWYPLLDSKQEANPSFGWSQNWAGRAEGYPENDGPPQLQDLLEFFTPDQNAQALVALAYEMGHQSALTTAHGHVLQEAQRLKQASVTMHANTNLDLHMHVYRQRSARSRQLSPTNKGLPDVPPPVPPKDDDPQGVASAPAMQSRPEEFVPWDRLISTIPEDDYTPDYDAMVASVLWD